MLFSDDCIGRGNTTDYQDYFCLTPPNLSPRGDKLVDANLVVFAGEVGTREPERPNDYSPPLPKARSGVNDNFLSHRITFVISLIQM